MEKKKNRVKIMFLVVMIAFIGFIWEKDCNSGLAATNHYNSIKKDVIKAYETYHTSVDISKYQIYNNQAGSKTISDIFEEILNESPDIFYTGRDFSKEVMTDSNQITKLYLSYANAYKTNGKVDSSKIIAARKKINTALNTAAKCVNSKMNSVEKAMMVHDYLVKNISYNDSAKSPNRINLIGALINKKANCQGYAVAYKALLNKVGVSADCVASQSMAHMWNKVKIGSYWYHVDVTWDDALSYINKKDQYGYVNHDYFLLSNSAARKAEHIGFTDLKTSTKYDKKYWKKVYTQFWYQNNSYVYGTSTGIYSRKRITDAKASCIKKVKEKCLVKYSTNVFFYISNNKIYRINIKNKKIKRLYSPAAGKSLQQLKYENHKIYFRYRKNGKLYSASKKVKAGGLL